MRLYPRTGYAVAHTDLATDVKPNLTSHNVTVCYPDHHPFDRAVRDADNTAVRDTDDRAVRDADNIAVRATDKCTVPDTDDCTISDTDDAAVCYADDRAVHSSDHDSDCLSIIFPDSYTDGGTDKPAFQHSDGGADALTFN